MSRYILPICGLATFAFQAHWDNAVTVDCIIDDVNGRYTNTDLNHAQPVRTQAWIAATCSVAKYEAGSVFNQRYRTSRRGVELCRRI